MPTSNTADVYNYFDAMDFDSDTNPAKGYLLDKQPYKGHDLTNKYLSPHHTLSKRENNATNTASRVASRMISPGDLLASAIQERWKQTTEHEGHLASLLKELLSIGAQKQRVAHAIAGTGTATARGNGKHFTIKPNLITKTTTLLPLMKLTHKLNPMQTDDYNYFDELDIDFLNSKNKYLADRIHSNFVKAKIPEMKSRTTVQEKTANIKPINLSANLTTPRTPQSKTTLKIWMLQVPTLTTPKDYYPRMLQSTSPVNLLELDLSTPSTGLYLPFSVNKPLITEDDLASTAPTEDIDGNETTDINVSSADVEKMSNREEEEGDKFEGSNTGEYFRSFHKQQRNGNAATKKSKLKHDGSTSTAPTLRETPSDWWSSVPENESNQTHENESVHVDNTTATVHKNLKKQKRPHSQQTVSSTTTITTEQVSPSEDSAKDVVDHLEDLLRSMRKHINGLLNDVNRLEADITPKDSKATLAKGKIGGQKSKKAANNKAELLDKQQQMNFLMDENMEILRENKKRIDQIKTMLDLDKEAQNSQLHQPPTMQW